MPLQGDQLSRMTIRGFKSIKNCDISFGKINVLIGSNGAGKSNFISAFSFLQNILSKNLQVSVGQSGLSSLLYKGRKVTEEIDFEVFFGQNSYGFALIPTDDNRLIFREEYFGYHGGWNNASPIGHGHSESHWESAAHNGIDDYVATILRKQNWRVYHFHDTGKDARVKQEHNISNNKMLLYDAANLAAFLYRLKNFFNSSQLSDGTLRFICLTTLLLQPHELQPATIIVDEPELGLHPYAITIFSEIVRQLSNEKQIMISTQSVELLNEFDVEDVIVVDRSDTGSEFRRLDPEQLKLWLDGDYTLGDLWKKNVLGGRLSK